MSAPTPSRTLAAEGAPRGGLAALCITQTTSWGVLYYALQGAGHHHRGPFLPGWWSPRRPVAVGRI